MSSPTDHTPRIAFTTLGCPKNEADTDSMRAQVMSSEYELVEDSGDADVIVLNTCSFIEDATQESIDTILDIAAEHLGQGSRSLVVTGCMPSRYGDELSAEFPEVAAFVSIADQKSILEVLERVTGVPARLAGQEYEDVVRTVDAAFAYVKIAEGCDRTCAYCAIPMIRGPYVSREMPDIVSEVEALVAMGVQEIVLVGQDTGLWGLDLGAGEGIVDLLREVSRVAGDAWVRVMYLQPAGVTDELLTAVRELPNVVEYFDIPLQHASKRILRSMHRAGDADAFLELINRIRAEVPGAAIRTTLIAGFPGETESELEELLAFIEEARFDYVGVFPYSPEAGTSAATLPDQLDDELRLERAQAVRDLADAISEEIALSRVGDVVTVLVEDIETDGESTEPVGRWRGQAPEIDGSVHLDSGEIGTFVQAELVDTFAYEYEAVVTA